MSYFDTHDGAEIEFLKECGPCLECGELKINLHSFFDARFHEARGVGEQETVEHIINLLERVNKANPNGYSPGLYLAIKHIRQEYNCQTWWEQIKMRWARLTKEADNAK